MRHSWRAQLALALVAAGCGARTGLLVPDVPTEASLDASPDDVNLFDACTPGTFALTRRHADVILLLDRSGSMQSPLEPASPTSRWQAMRDGLSNALPHFDAALDLGAMLFPRAINPNDPLNSLGCEVGNNIDVAPAPGNAARVLNMLAHSLPDGGTPTAQAVWRTGWFLSQNTPPDRGRAIVLSTDGGPNCGNGMSLDDDTPNTVNAIAQTLARGVPTFVIGIDDPSQPMLLDALNRMADAGGRTNPASTTQRYYSVRHNGDVYSTFDSIQRTLALCTLRTPSRPDDPDSIDVLLDGGEVPRDSMHLNGWDWTDRHAGEITFYGPPCDRLAMGSDDVRARVGCHDGG